MYKNEMPKIDIMYENEIMHENVMSTKRLLLIKIAISTKIWQSAQQI